MQLQSKRRRCIFTEKDKDAWSYARELATLELHKASDQDHTLEDGSNEAAAKFMTMIEDHRKKLEEEQEEERLRLAEEEPTKRALADENRTNPVVNEVKVEGFTMFKLVEGRMLEYWIVPGKLPVLVGEVGAPDAEPQTPEAGSLPMQINEDDIQSLNG